MDVHIPHNLVADTSEDYWHRRCQIAEDRVMRLIRECDDQGIGALGGMAICTICGLLFGFGLGWWAG